MFFLMLGEEHGNIRLLTTALVLLGEKKLLQNKPEEAFEALGKAI